MGLCSCVVGLCSCVMSLSFGYILLKVWRYAVNWVVSCFLVALSFCNNPIDSGTGKPGAVAGCPEGIPPEGDSGAAQAR